MSRTLIWLRLIYESAGFGQEAPAKEQTHMQNTDKMQRRRLLASGLSLAAVAALPARFLAGSNMQKHTEGEEMPTLTTYLLFDCRCEPAMQFYKSCFGGDLQMMKVKDSPAAERLPAAQREKVINARLKSNVVDISASDWLRPDRERVPGNTVCLYLSGGSLQELKALFEKLSEGANVTDPLREEFFGCYGALNDKYGVRWMFQTDKKE
jgi:PhnB protein